MTLPFEMYRTRCVEAIRETTREERVAALDRAHHNLFLLRAADVLIDLLTDSGTGALSDRQWAAMMLGDESYAGSRSFERFETVVRNLTGMRHVFPTHQGRAAERILFECLLRPGDVVVANTHFDTTRANVERVGAEPRDLPCAAARDTAADHPFKGNIDLEALESLLESDEGERVRLVIITITNNSGGGQPVSMENVRAARRLCDIYRKPLFLDACRFAENAWLVKEREYEQRSATPQQIAQEMFRLADGCTMSAKKDGLAHIGGFLALNDDRLAQKVKTNLVVTEGFPTYGGLAGRDLEAIATGLEEAVEEHYLRDRFATVRHLGDELIAAGIPIVRPVGGHAVFIDARRFLPHIAPLDYPGIALANELYLRGGIRTSEIGTAMFGSAEHAASMDLVRLALPRRTYTRAQLDYVARVVIDIARERSRVRGYRMIWAPESLRHFQAHFEPLETHQMA